MYTQNKLDEMHASFCVRGGTGTRSGHEEAPQKVQCYLRECMVSKAGGTVFTSLVIRCKKTYAVC
jgi:hypothetical protein